MFSLLWDCGFVDEHWREESAARYVRWEITIIAVDKKNMQKYIRFAGYKNLCEDRD